MRHHRQLLSHARRLLPAGRAEEAVQQALLRALEAMRADQRELQLGPWLHRIVHNTAIDALRRLDSHWEELDERMDGVESTHSAVERRARFRSVVARVGSLPERQRRALVLRELEGRSYKEISATLGVSGAGVRQLLNRARNAVRAGAGALVPPALTSALLTKSTAAVAAGTVAVLAVAGPPPGDPGRLGHAAAVTDPPGVERGANAGLSSASARAGTGAAAGLDPRGARPGRPARLASPEHTEAGRGPATAGSRGEADLSAADSEAPRGGEHDGATGGTVQPNGVEAGGGSLPSVRDGAVGGDPGDDDAPGGSPSPLALADPPVLGGEGAPDDDDATTVGTGPVGDDGEAGDEAQDATTPAAGGAPGDATQVVAVDDDTEDDDDTG